MHVSPSNKRYIGLTKINPKTRWRNGKGYKNNKYFTSAVKKYGWDNFQHIIIAKSLTEDEAKWLEVELIREWDTTNRDKGYNISLGGEGTSGLCGENSPMFGKHHTEKTKEMMSERKKEIYNGEGNPMFGKTHSKEARKKMSENHADFNGKNNPRAKAIILLNTKEVFPTAKEASEKYHNAYPSNIARCCNGKAGSAGKHPITGEKLVWMYYKDYLKLIKEMEI